MPVAPVTNVRYVYDRDFCCQNHFYHHHHHHVPECFMKTPKMLKTWQLWTQGSNPSEWCNMMLWQIYKRSSELSPIRSGAPWNPAKVQQHLAPCASPHIPLLPCCTNPGVFPPSHILFNLGTTYFDQNSLGECFSDLAHKSPELQEEFLYNAETQVETHPPH